jgi:peptide/nickel transport system permease protein
VPRALLGRLAQAALVVLLVVTATFALIRLSPRDPFAAVAESPEAPPDVRERLRSQYGFADPLHVQYGRFVMNVARGDLGWSLSRSAPVRRVLATALPNTIILTGSALLLGLLGGIALGAWEGWRPQSALARAADRAGLVVLAVPEFVLALLLVLGPALALDLFPVGGIRDDFAPTGLRGLLDRLHHLALPTLALATILTAVVARHQRAAMAAVREREFVRAARARGLGEGRIFFRHALRNALVPVLTLAGVLIPSLFGGAVLVETVFGWPGMGRLTVDAVLSADYHLVVGCVLVSSLAVVTGSLLADLAVLWADPRLRRDR